MKKDHAVEERPSDGTVAFRSPPPRRWYRHWGTRLALVGLPGAVGVLGDLAELLPEGAGPVSVVSGLIAGVVLPLAAEIVHSWIEEPQEQPAAGRVLRERLPLRSEHFTGQDEAVREILRLFRRFPRTGARRLVSVPSWPARGLGPLVVAVTGDGGTGKTELVNQVVGRVEDRFPDGKLEFQLYGDREEALEPAPRRGLLDWVRAAPQRAVRPARRTPRKPEKVLAQLLTEMGAAPHSDLPLDELHGQWLTITRDRRLLVVLDNAKDFAQVEPLLPKGPGCAVLITSRNAFSDAPGYVRRHPLGRLAVEQGVLLLRRLTGSTGGAGGSGAPEDATLTAIVRECYQLPIAICWCGGRLAAENAPAPEDLLRRLRQDKDRAGITASFSFSFEQCSADERLLLVRVARTGLATFTPWAAAALVSASAYRTGALLEEMADRYLVVRLPGDQTGHARFQLHDHVRRILLDHGPGELGVPEEELDAWSDSRFAAAVDRLLNTYAWLAGQAARSRAPQEWRFPQPAVAAPSPADGLDLSVPENPEAWLDAERKELRACIELARERADARLGWWLARALAGLCRDGRVYWEDWHAATEEASVLARGLGDRLAYGISLLDRAEIAGSQGGHGIALRRARAARWVLGEGADERWQARVARVIGVNLYRRGDIDDGRVELDRAERVFARTGEHWWHARTLCNLADLYRFRGDMARAYTLLDRARAGFGDDAEQLVKVRLQMGDVLGKMGRDLSAWTTLDEALTELDRLDGGVWYRARCLRAMGRLDPRRLHRQFEDCDLLLSPTGDERREQAIQEHLWRETLGAPAAMRERGDRVVARWYEERTALIRGHLGEEHWEKYVAPAPGPPRWRKESADRLRGAREGWSLRHHIELVEQAYEMLAEIGDAWGKWRTLLILGELRMGDDPDRGQRELEEAALGFRELGDEWWHARALRRTAEALLAAGRLGSAEDTAEQVREGYAKLNHLSGRLRAQLLLGRVQQHRGDHLAALRTLREAQGMAEEGLAQKRVPQDLYLETRREVSTLLGEEL